MTYSRTALDLLAALESAGFVLAVAGERLTVTPGSLLSIEQRKDVAANKDGLLQLVRDMPTADQQRRTDEAGERVSVFELTDEVTLFAALAAHEAYIREKNDRTAAKRGDVTRTVKATKAKEPDRTLFASVVPKEGV